MGAGAARPPGEQRFSSDGYSTAPPTPYSIPPARYQYAKHQETAIKTGLRHLKFQPRRAIETGRPSHFCCTIFRNVQPDPRPEILQVIEKKVLKRKVTLGKAGLYSLKAGLACSFYPSPDLRFLTFIIACKNNIAIIALPANTLPLIPRIIMIKNIKTDDK